jgi:DNA-binding transcriptional LysR family regulator
LPAFEASSRLLDFTKACEELHISQTAISQQIRTLENNFGVKLFNRDPRKITLTEHGQKFQRTVSFALELIENSATLIRSQDSKSEFTIASDITMAHRWLIPYFSQFREQFPDIDVSILASEIENECLTPNVDLALLYGRGRWDGFNARLLFPEEVFPVCTPDYYRTHSPLKFDSSLEHHVLLNLKAERRDWVDWQQLLNQNRIILSKQTRYYEFNNLPLLIQATLKGHEIGLGWRSLIDNYLDSGELIKPFDVSLKTDRGYYVLRRANIKETMQAALLYDWIISSKPNVSLLHHVSQEGRSVS